MPSGPSPRPGSGDGRGRPTTRRIERLGPARGRRTGSGPTAPNGWTRARRDDGCSPAPVVRLTCCAAGLPPGGQQNRGAATSRRKAPIGSTSPGTGRTARSPLPPRGRRSSPAPRPGLERRGAARSVGGLAIRDHPGRVVGSAQRRSVTDLPRPSRGCGLPPTPARRDRLCGAGGVVDDGLLVLARRTDVSPARHAGSPRTDPAATSATLTGGGTGLLVAARPFPQVNPKIRGLRLPTNCGSRV